MEGNYEGDSLSPPNSPTIDMGRKLQSVQNQAQDLLAARTTSRGRPKLWKNYTADEKRIAVAFDVIQGVLAGLYDPKASNGYLPIQGIKQAGKEAQVESVQALITGGHLQDCEVCALGACFLSVVRFDNHLNFTELTPIYSYSTEEGQKSPFATKLLGVFEHHQLQLIEYAFEESQYSTFGDRAPGWRKASNFGYKYDNDTDRILAICMNIIKNKGTFKP